MPRLEDVANVALRVPAIVLLDVLYRWDVEAIRGEFTHPSYNASGLQSHLLYNGYYLAHVVCAVLVILPLRHLLNIYLYLLTSLLLYAAHRTVRDSIGREVAVGYSGSVYEDRTSLTRNVSALTGLVMLCSLCSLLMRTRQAWLFSAPVVPLLARLSGFPLRSLPLLNAVSTGGTLLVMCYVAASGFRPLCRLFAKAYQELTQVMEVYRLVALGMALWTQLAVPAIFLVFWAVLYFLHVYSVLSSKPDVLEQQGPIFILLNSVSECCGTPYCLLGLTFTVSYLSLGMLNLCKFYLMGYAAFQNGNAMHRGVTEGVTMMLLSLQTGLLELQVLQRTFLLSIIFFIVVTSTLQSMIEIADPIVLALAATGNRSVWRHVRGLSLCLFLLIFPTFMAYKIAYFFHMDFWLLILVSSCLLTSLQVLGTLFIYVLFMMELFQESRVERIDEIIYGVNAISRVLEFLVALCVVAYGTWESIFGEWSWMGVSVIIVHSYFNVWLRAQSGWRSFLLRREAAKKISHLPKATEEELRAHNDVCSICFQEMSLAVITPCEHIFHADCLKKWLYIQDTCPLCHKLVRPDDQDDEEEEESDSDERGAGGQGGIQGRGRDADEAAGENMEEESPTRDQEEESPTRDYEERRTFVGENHHVVDEDTCRETEQETGNVFRKMEGVIFEKQERILHSGLEEDHYRKEQEDILYMEKQEDEVFHIAGQGKEVQSSKGVLLHRGGQRNGLHCMKEQKNEFLRSEKEKIVCMEDQLAQFRRTVQIPFREVKNVCYWEEQDSGDPVLYKEDQEVVPTRKVVQVFNTELEEHPDKEVLKEEVPCRQEKILHSEMKAIPCRKPVEAPCRDAEKIAEENLYRKEQEVVSCSETVQALYREVEEK